jgi:hypothetical protein
LKSNSLGVDDCKALAEGLKGNSVMKELNIANNELTNYGRDMSGVIYLADVLPGMRALTKLDARDNYPGDEGTDALEKAAGSRCARL